MRASKEQLKFFKNNAFMYVNSFGKSLKWYQKISLYIKVKMCKG